MIEVSSSLNFMKILDFILELVGAYHPVMPKDISECKMNVKLKVDSYGNPIKVKARLCARNPNVATSSPTASRSTVITTCIIASAQKRHVATADITGAHTSRPK
jgi:hypothetical protein